MQLPDTPGRARETSTTLFAHPPQHYQWLQAAIPAWLGNASLARLKALQAATPALPPRLKNAPAAQQAELKRLNAAHWSAQNHAEQMLKNLRNANDFAEPLLKEALNSRFGVDVDVTQVFVRFYLPATLPWFPVKSGAARTWTVSLLEAALHNFEERETASDAYDPASTYITAPTSNGQFETLPQLLQAMPIPSFTTLCRELDIGSQYRLYLEDNLGISNPVVAARLHPRVEASQKAAFRAALQFARMSGDIEEDFYRQLKNLVNGSRNIVLDNRPVHCHDLTMMSAKLTGIMLFAPDLELSRGAARVVAYIPDDPEHPIKQYASTGQLAQTLTRQLRAADYQQFFSRFVAHEDRGYFFGNLVSRLTHVTWNPPTHGDPRPSWRETANERPNLQLAAIPIRRAPWPHLYRETLDKILNDARVIAIATTSVDQKARWALWDSFASAASAIAQVAAFIVLPFVPFMGELMLAYMAYQLVDEAFEGIIDWAEGLTAEAFEHLMTVTQSLIGLGTFAAGGVLAAGEFRQLLPAEVVKFIDQFKPVTAANGKTLYWKPDLSAYERPIALPARATPNTLGLHEQAGKNILRIERQHFAVVEDAQPGRHRIEHPTRPDAYRPRLEHNGSGAWQTEIDQPLQWDKSTLLNRLGPLSEKLAPVELERALHASGHHENVVRKMHVEHEPMPSLLADTLKRFNIDKDLQGFIDSLGSEHFEQYSTADSQTQLQLLTEHFLWPEHKGIRLFDTDGRLAWETPGNAKLIIEIRDSQLTDGDLLKTLLGHLTESEQKTLLEEERGSPTQSPSARATTLRQKLAQTAARQRTSLFDRRYRALEHSHNARVQTLLDTTPGLPLSVAIELVENASGVERQQLHNGEMPQRLRDQARQARQAVRVTRAYEGVDLASVENPDSDLLLLHSVERLPGWSSTVRIELRDYSYNGTVRARIGNQDATVRKVLARREDGRFEAYDDEGQHLSGATDLYRAILSALPDSERKALNINIHEGEQLKQTLREHLIERTALQDLLQQDPVLKPTFAPHIMRLPGGADGYEQLQPGAPSLHRRLRKLYPALDADQRQELIERLHNHPFGADVELARQQTEYTQLSQDLQAWVGQAPHIDPGTGNQFNALQIAENKETRLKLKAEILRSWRRQITATGAEANPEEFEYWLSFSWPIIGELPRLTADFSRVTTLSLTNSGAPQGLPEFLQHFSGLTRLELREVALGELPVALAHLPTLQELLLIDCGIALTPEARTTLSSLKNLKILDLYRNPLALHLNLGEMPELTYADLSSTGISRVPDGFSAHPKLRTMILNDNQITELPRAFFDLPAEAVNGIDLGNNPLTLATHEHIKVYFGRTRQDFGVFAPAADIERAQELFPLMDREEASDFVYHRPGNLEAGRSDLTRLEHEYTKLRNDLAAWTSDLPAIHPQTGQPFTNLEIAEEHLSRDTFKATLETCWRRESDQEGTDATGQPLYELYSNELINGDLPVLTADFGHVSRLQLDGDEATTSGMAPFLRGFPNLRSLVISEYAMGSIPEAVFNMGELTTLALTDCQITLTSHTQAALTGMENIKHLVLGGNPLGLPADVSQMHQLKTLMLYDTDISEIPPGLLSRTTLQVANLSDNAITDVPSDILELPAETAQKIRLSGNPFSEESLQRLFAYFQRTGEDFGIDEVMLRAQLEASTSEGSEVDE
jgi:Leucine-rich repeat (LRR) protein